jgi:hypothetical protein
MTIKRGEGKDSHERTTTGDIHFNQQLVFTGTHHHSLGHGISTLL